MFWRKRQRHPYKQLKESNSTKGLFRILNQRKQLCKNKKRKKNCHLVSEKDDKPFKFMKCLKRKLNGVSFTEFTVFVSYL
jgi:hypothetical protein